MSWARGFATGLLGKARARLRGLGPKGEYPSRRPFRNREHVSLGGGLYISGEEANHLAQMADKAMRDTRWSLSLKNLSAEERRNALATWPAPFVLNLGEMTNDEMIAHMAMVSDYNKRGRE